MKAFCPKGLVAYWSTSSTATLTTRINIEIVKFMTWLTASDHKTMPIQIFETFIQKPRN